MPADASIYFQQQPLDILGNIQRGLQMRDQMDQRKLAEAERLKQQKINEAYQAGVVQNPDGSVTYDKNKTLMALAGAGGGKETFNLGENIYTQNTAEQKYKDALAQQDREFQWRQDQGLIDNDLRRQSLQSSAADRKEARDERRYQAGLVRDEKIQALQTPYGLANTVDDAKQLKDAHLAKQAFDNKLQQMIDLRTKNNGGALFNREDVARGKQLSKDLLLEYKNMAKLGVLSKSDEDIINAIIPEDPLEYNSPLAAIQGQDPTLQRMKAFQADSTKNFNDGIATRTRAGMDLYASPSSAIQKSSRTSELNMSPKATKADNQAVQWAKQNPKDPRSAQILKMNGLGG